MSKFKILIRIFIWSFIVLSIALAIFLSYFGDVNRLKKLVETNLKDQLTCVVKLGDLSWDLEGLKFGFLASDISLYDHDNNLVLQAGPTRFVWDIRNIIQGHYSHFYSIDSTNLYLNAIFDRKGVLNLVAIFPPGPPPKIDNLKLHNSIIYLVDNSGVKKIKGLYKDLNVNWEIKPYSKKRKIDLTARVGAVQEQSFFKLKGKYTESEKFNWNKDEFNFFLVARKIELSNFYAYLNNLIKGPVLNDLEGEFSGVLIANKKKKDPQINLRCRTVTNKLFIKFAIEDLEQKIEIPKTNFILRALVDKDKIKVINFKSSIDELVYELKGDILYWSKKIPEVNLEFKTNRFNFKSVKPYLPLSLLPLSTRQRIEPINDDGFVTLDLKLQGNQFQPKYFGTILLDNFNLTEDSGFLSAIKGLNGKLTLNNEILNIDYLNIPIDLIPLTIMGFVDSGKIITSFNLLGKDLNVSLLKDLITQAGLQSSLLSSIVPEGKLDLNLEVYIEKTNSPEIKGSIGFRNVGALLLSEDPIDVGQINGNLILDGGQVIFDNLGGLINKEPFSVQGNFSLREDEKINLFLSAKHLKILSSLLSQVTAKTPFSPVAKTITGEASDLNLKIAGTLSKPLLDGTLFINNVSFGLPNLADKIKNLTGELKFQGADILIENLNGKIQEANFQVSGIVKDLFTIPKPYVRLVTGDIEISNFWSYIKDQLKTSSLDVQAQAVEKLIGYASLDLSLKPDLVTGSLNFRDGVFRYKTLPFDINNLSGMLAVGDKDINILGFMGSVGNNNKFNCDLAVFNYLNPDYTIMGKLNIDLDPEEFVMVVNPELMNVIYSEGIIPTQADFDIAFPNINVNLVSILDEMLLLEFPGFLKKPVNKSYAVTANLDFDSEDLNLYLNNLNIKTNKLSLTTMGSIKDLASKEPQIMLFFATDEPSGIFMITEPIIPLMGFKVWGMIELNGSINGTASMYEVSSYAMVYDVELPELNGRKLTAMNGEVSTFFDGMNGIFNAEASNIMIAELTTDTLSLSANYVDPVINVNKFILTSTQGSISGLGFYDPRDGGFDFNVSGKNIDLPSLASLSITDTSKIAGKTDFALVISGKGKEKDEIIKNTDGVISFTITDGKIGQLGLLQKVLQVSNIFSSGIFGLNVTNVFSLFFKYQDGSFNNVKGTFNLKKGYIETKEFIYRARDLLFNAYGFIDLNKSFMSLRFYGFLPVTSMNKDQVKSKSKESIKNKVTNTVSGAITIIPDTFGKSRLFIPFLTPSGPRYFKFELEGNTKEQKKIISHARRTFKWIKKKNLKIEEKFLPKADIK